MKKIFASLPKLLQDFVVDFIAALSVAIGIYNFASAANFAPGGISGVGIIMQHLVLQWFGVEVPLGVWNFLLNIPIIIFSWRYVGRKYLLRTFRTVVMLSIVMDLIAPLIPLYTGMPLLASIFGGVFLGFGLGIAFANQTCTGGMDLVIMSVKKIKPHMSLGQITLILDFIIIIWGGIVFKNIDAVLYGFVFIFIVTKVIDIVTTGGNSGKMALIITDDGYGLGKEIDAKVQRGATILQGKGAYTGNDKEIVLCALSRQQLPVLREVISDYDPSALLIVLEYKDVFGTGFQPHFDPQ